MSDNHERWLKEQGASIVGRRLARRVRYDPMAFIESSKLSYDSHFLNQEEDTIFQIEASVETVDKWYYAHQRLSNVYEYAERTGGMPEDFFIKNNERHRALLRDNPMYRDAWKEFQSIRALVGENTAWP